MVSRPIGRTLGVAAGGLLGAALFPSAAAFADDIYSIDPAGIETITGLYNMTTAPPGINESLQGYGTVNILNSSGVSDGSVYGYESTSPYLMPSLGTTPTQDTTQILYVDSAAPGTDASTNALPNGSVVSILNFGNGSEDVYTAIPNGDGGDTVSYIVYTPAGPIDLSAFVDSLGFDAANLTPALPSVPGDTITALDAPTITSVSGLPPATMVLQGVQNFEYNGNASDTFTAVETTTQDLVGTHTEALLVTQSSGADSLPVGSLYNVIDFDGLQNIYSSVPQADGTDTVTDILYDPSTGQTTDLTPLFSGFDASTGLSDGSSIQDISFGNYVISADPNSPEVFTGVNGLPPLNASVQGTQLFDLYQNGSETPTATFTGDITTMPDNPYFHYSEALLVTNSSDPAVLPDGSVFDVATYGSGYENVYSDLPGLGADGNNLITDTYVTPFGDYDLSSLYAGVDASAGLSPSDGLVNFLDAAWLALFPTT
jgi:hypothetical protein